MHTFTFHWTMPRNKVNMEKWFIYTGIVPFKISIVFCTKKVFLPRAVLGCKMDLHKMALIFNYRCIQISTRIVSLW